MDRRIPETERTYPGGQLGERNQCPRQRCPLHRGCGCRNASSEFKHSLSYSVPVIDSLGQSLFQEKDYLDSRFLHKKAFFVASVASAIKTGGNFDIDVYYEAASRDARLTNIMLVPRKGQARLLSFIVY